MSDTVKAPPLIEDGTRVRVNRLLTPDELVWAVQPRTGSEFTVDEVLLYAENPDPQPDDIGVDFLDGHDDNGSTVIMPISAVEVVKTAAEMAARKPPTRQQIRDSIQSSLLDSYDEFEINEADRDGIYSVECYGRTNDGLPFAFTVAVTHVWETDL